MYDPSKMSRAPNCLGFVSSLRKCPLVPYWVDAATHYKIVNTFIYNCVVDHFPLDSHVKKNKWITDATYSAIRSNAKLRRTMWKSKLKLDRSSLFAVFHSWKHGCPRASYSFVFAFGSINNVLQYASDKKALAGSSHSVRSLVRLEREAMIDKLADDLEECLANGSMKGLHDGVAKNA